MSALATRQFGPVHREQVIGCGLSPRMIDQDLLTGRLHRMLPCVYGVGHLHLRPEGRRMAALLFGGEGSFLSGRSATAHLDVLADLRSVIDIGVVGSRKRSHGFVRVHHRDHVDDDEVDTVDGITFARLPLALLDIAAGSPARFVERALDQAEILELLDMRALEALLDRRAGERGAGVLRTVLADHAIAETITRSELEDLCLRVLRRQGFATPLTNRRIRGATEWWEADLLWPGARLAIETDGLKFHRTPARRERDRRRDADLMAAGWLVLRVTWRMLKREPDLLRRAVQAALNR